MWLHSRTLLEMPEKSTNRSAAITRIPRRRILNRVIRPCFLVIDKQFPASISTRKLVIETAMLNVLTAYSAEEAVAMLTRFPKVDGVVMDTEVRGMPCVELIEKLRVVRVSACS